MREFAHPIYANGFAPGLLLKLIRFRPDVIIASTYSSFFTHVGLLYARLFRVPFVVFSEDWIWSRSLLRVAMFPFIRYIITKSDAIVAAGTKAKDFANRHGASKVFLGINSASDLSNLVLDNEKMNKLKKKYVGKRVILYQSRIVKYKGLDVLIKAMSLLGKNYENITLLIGGDGDFRDECIELAGQLNISNYEFLGYVPQDDIPYYFNLCDVFVLPTRYLAKSTVPAEAWGLVINEAMSVGKPIVSTSAVAAAYDLIEPGLNGFIVPHSNPKALAKAIHIILQSPLTFGENSLQILKKAEVRQQRDAFSNAIKHVIRSKITRR
ncbi:MAG: glycosyltransferase family 4 protein [Candidatus Thorarchaeota archaeon]